MVQVHDAFTGKWFGDSSLILVTDYHPLAQTLAEKHFAAARGGGRAAGGGGRAQLPDVIALAGELAVETAAGAMARGQCEAEAGQRADDAERGEDQGERGNRDQRHGRTLARRRCRPVRRTS